MSEANRQKAINDCLASNVGSTLIEVYALSQKTSVKEMLQLTLETLEDGKVVRKKHCLFIEK